LCHFFFSLIVFSSLEGLRKSLGLGDLLGVALKHPHVDHLEDGEGPRQGKKEELCIKALRNA
jgi:hypothetical protein